MALSFDALACLRPRCVELHRNGSFAVAGEGRGHHMAEPVQRISEQCQFVSGTVRDRTQPNEPD